MLTQPTQGQVFMHVDTMTSFSSKASLAPPWPSDPGQQQRPCCSSGTSPRGACQLTGWFHWALPVVKEAGLVLTRTDTCLLLLPPVFWSILLFVDLKMTYPSSQHLTQHHLLTETFYKRMTYFTSIESAVLSNASTSRGSWLEAVAWPLQLRCEAS